MEKNTIDETRELLPEDKIQQPEQFIRDIFMNRAKTEKLEKAERFRHLNKLVRPNQILLVGSSLMEQFPVHELMADRQISHTVYNRGIGGYTTDELLATMDVCIYDLHPAKIFINIGTNDLNEPDYTEEALIENYRKILEGIRTHLPKAEIYLMAYYPVNPDLEHRPVYLNEVFRMRTNKRIHSANLAVQTLAAEMDARFIDCNAGITDKEGRMKEEYAIEGVHMYGDGYMPVLEALLPYFE